MGFVVGLESNFSNKLHVLLPISEEFNETYQWISPMTPRGGGRSLALARLGGSREQEVHVELRSY